VITIEDLLLPDVALRRFASQPEMDPLTEDGALLEAQLLDIRFDALRSTVGLLFEMRTAWQLREANTGVLVCRGVREIFWEAEPRTTDKTAWVVGESTPNNENRLFGLSLGMFGAFLSLVAESAAFFCGDVPGLVRRIPDYGREQDAAVRSQLPGWHSTFVPVRAVFLDPAPSQ